MAKQKIGHDQIAETYARSVVNSSEQRANSAFGDLATPQSITITVGRSGMVQLGIGAMTGNTSAGSYNIMAYEASGANTIPATDNTGCYCRTTIALGAGAGEQTISKTFLLTGLTPGVTTFKLLFRATAGTGAFERREMWALAL